MQPPPEGRVYNNLSPENYYNNFLNIYQSGHMINNNPAMQPLMNRALFNPLPMEPASFYGNQQPMAVSSMNSTMPERSIYPLRNFVDSYSDTNGYAHLPDPAYANRFVPLTNMNSMVGLDVSHLNGLSAVNHYSGFTRNSTITNSEKQSASIPSKVVSDSSVQNSNVSSNGNVSNSLLVNQRDSNLHLSTETVQNPDTKSNLKQSFINYGAGEGSYSSRNIDNDVRSSGLDDHSCRLVAYKRAQTYPLYMLHDESAMVNIEQCQTMENICCDIYEELSSILKADSEGSDNKLDFNVKKLNVKSVSSLSSPSSAQLQNIDQKLNISNNNPDLYQCCICVVYSTESLDEIKVHAYNETNILSDEQDMIVRNATMECKFCNYTTDSKINFKAHCKGKKHIIRKYKSSHSSKRHDFALGKEDCDIKLRCNSCDFSTSSITGLKMHSRSSAHLYNTDIFTTLKLKEGDSNGLLKMYRCRLCQVSLVNKTRLIKHLASDQHIINNEETDELHFIDIIPTDKVEFEISANETTFSKSSDRMDGLRENKSSSSENWNNNCNKISVIKQILIKRSSQEKNTTIFICPFCKYSSDSESSSIMHVLKHSKILSSYNCPLCVLGFDEWSDLQCHIGDFHHVGSESFEQIRALIGQKIGKSEKEPSMYPNLSKLRKLLYNKQDNKSERILGNSAKEYAGAGMSKLSYSLPNICSKNCPEGICKRETASVMSENAIERYNQNAKFYEKPDNFLTYYSKSSPSATSSDYETEKLEHDKMKGNFQVPHSKYSPANSMHGASPTMNRFTDNCENSPNFQINSSQNNLTETSPVRREETYKRLADSQTVHSEYSLKENVNKRLSPLSQNGDSYNRSSNMQTFDSGYSFNENAFTGESSETIVNKYGRTLPTAIDYSNKSVNN